MNRDDIEKLLGGYAAGTLTGDERQALFAAALEDQELFESLAAEEPLRELLQDPAAKAQLLAALDDRPAPWYRRLLWPGFGIAAAAAMLLMAVFVRHEPPKPEPVVVAETRREPVRSFQPPLPVEKSPLPTVLRTKPAALPPPPEFQAAPPVAAPLDTLAPVAPAAPPTPNAQNAAEALSAAVVQQDAAKVQAAPVARAQTVRTLNMVAAKGDAASASRLGLRYTVYKKSLAGELTEVDPANELERSDQVVFRFETSEPGFLSVSQLDEPNGLRTIASESLLPSVPYIVPSTGSLQAKGAVSEFRVLFSRQPQSLQKFAPAARGKFGAAGGAVPASAEPAAQQATFNITLKYK